MPFYQEVTCGILAATSASFVFVPRFEIEKLIVADAALPAAQRVNYRSAGHAISSIVTKKGISALWKGQYRVTVGTLHCTTFLLSYNQSFCYLKDSVHVDESCARLGKSILDLLFSHFHLHSLLSFLLNDSVSTSQIFQVDLFALVVKFSGFACDFAFI